MRASVSPSGAALAGFSPGAPSQPPAVRGALRAGVRRRGLLTAVALCALLLAACSGSTTGATNIARQADGFYTAQLNAVGTCKSTCSAFLRWRQVGRTTWTNGPTLNSGKVSNVPFSQTATGLFASAQYEYQVCGKEANDPAIQCVGPNGALNSTQIFATGPQGATLRSTWTQLHPAVSPSPRGAVMSYDPGMGQTLLFGGFNTFSDGDTWSWNGSAWTQWTPATSPPARSFDALSYDYATRQMIMFGGDQIGGSNFADTWNWTGTDWVQLHPATSPPNRSYAQMAFDSATGQLVLFGGFQFANATSGAGNNENDTWTWDGATWTQQHPATSPPVTFDGALAFDANLQKLVLFGGNNSSSAWTWDGSNWSPLSSAVNPPARSQTQMAEDPATGGLILAPGSDPAGNTWALGGGWTQLAPSTRGPAAQYTSLAPDPGSGHVMLFGNGNVANLSNATWIWGPLTLDAKALAVAQTGHSYSQTLQETGATGGVSWQVSSGSLPAGLTLSQTGVISGTPTASGTYSFTVSVTDSGAQPQTALQLYGLTVNQGPIPGVYVANGANSQINGFALGATGDAKPVYTLAGPNTTLNGIGGLGFDGQANLWVANSGTNAVDEFAAGVGGNTAPASTLSGNNTMLSGPAGVTFDTAGNLYVADRNSNAVTVYAPGAQTGDAAPIRTIIGANTGLAGPQALTVDGSGNLWAVNTQANTVTAYAPGANGDAAPKATISGQFNHPTAITQAASGNLLIADTFGQGVRSYSGTTPVGVYSSSQLSHPDGIDVDANGNQYVADQLGGLDVFPAGASGTTTPTAVISGPNTNLANPGPVAVVPPLHILTRRLPRAKAHHRYQKRLRALLGRSPWHWRIVRGRLPRGLRLTSAGIIRGTPRKAGTYRFTTQVADSTQPAMRARQTYTLAVHRPPAAGRTRPQTNGSHRHGSRLAASAHSAR